MVTADTPFGQKKLGRKHIKSFASGIAHMFACSAQHYAWLADQHQLSTVAIDLLEMRIEPAEFDIERNRILVGMCQRRLFRNAGQLVFPRSLRGLHQFYILPKQLTDSGFDSKPWLAVT